MENNINNEIKEVKNDPKKSKWTKKRIFIIVGIALVFVAIIVLICISATAPKKVTFTAPGKFGFKLPAALISDQTNGSTVTPPSASSLEIKHYEFAGWYENKEGTGDPIDFTTKVFTESTTVYGIWNAKKYTITYNYNGGELKGESKNPTYYYINHELTAAEKNSGDVVLSRETLLLEPVKDGKTFDGWMIKVDNSEEILNNGKVIKTIELKKIITSLLEDPVGNITIEAEWK